jgi:ABC-type transport system substrate-binding protein
MKRTTCAAVAALGLLATAPAYSQGHLRIALTAADTPATTGSPTFGYEGLIFAGYPVFETLVAWDLSNRDTTRAAGLVPGLATEWTVSSTDPRAWTFRLRPGVSFHDGSPFNADAVIWNLHRIYDERSPQFDVNGSALIRSRVPVIEGWEKVDDMTVLIRTRQPASYFPYMAALLFLTSPTAWEAAGRDWAAFGRNPAGTGPFRVTRVTPRTSIEMARHDGYWNAERRARLARLTLLPMPDPNTRVAALRSNQVDWIEVPPPDAVPSLRAAGFSLSFVQTPSVWGYHLRADAGSPLADPRVRQALNYAVDRTALARLVNEIAAPAAGFWWPDDANFGNPANRYRHDPERARALLAEAGYGPDRPLRLTIRTANGSGQILPIPMNEVIQRSFAALGIELRLQTVEFPQLIAGTRQPPGAAVNQGIEALNYSLPTTDFSLYYRFFHSRAASPASANWGHYRNPELDRVLDTLEAEFDPVRQAELVRRAHEIIVDDPPFLWGLHDRSGRAMSARVAGFAPARSPFVDLTAVSVRER